MGDMEETGTSFLKRKHVAGQVQANAINNLLDSELTYCGYHILSQLKHALPVITLNEKAFGFEE